MSCFISEALSLVSSPSPVRQFTSWLRSSLFKVPSSSKSREAGDGARKDVVRMSSSDPRLPAGTTRKSPRASPNMRKA